MRNIYWLDCVFLETQRYKEGKVILERALVTESDGIEERDPPVPAPAAAAQQQQWTLSLVSAQHTYIDK